MVMETWLNTLDSPETHRVYRRVVESAMSELGELNTVNAVKLTQYRDQWNKRLDLDAPDRLSPASVSLHLAALRSFLRFARITGQLPLPDDVIRFSLKSPKATVIKPYQVFTAAERSRLLSAARKNLRDRVLLDLAIATGLRAAEICAIQIGDLSVDDEGDLLLRVRQGKGRKDRIVPLDVDTAAIVRAYLKGRQLELGSKRDQREYLFASRKGRGHGRLSTARLRQLFDLYRTQAGIEKSLSPHSGRHTTAMNLLNSGADVVVVQKILGHANLATTQKYVDHLKLRDLKDAVNAARP